MKYNQNAKILQVTAEEQSIKIALVNPFHVKRSKELDDNNPTKNDRKDPKTIAMLVKDGRFIKDTLAHPVLCINEHYIHVG